MSNLFDQIEYDTGLQVVYSHFKKTGTPKEPPYLATIGAGQDNFEADNTYYQKHDLTQLELYFAEKNPTLEAKIEKDLLDNGLLYTKSEDVYIEDQGVFVIYYTF